MTFLCIGDEEVPKRQGLGVWDLEDKEDWGGLSGHGTAERQWGRVGGGGRGRWRGLLKGLRFRYFGGERIHLNIPALNNSTICSECQRSCVFLL